MDTDRIGPEPHECTICHQSGLPPEVMPYCTGGDIKNPIHSWAHPMCVFAVMEAKRKVRMKSEAFQESHENGDGC
jgi:hypothetical protein